MPKPELLKDKPMTQKDKEMLNSMAKMLAVDWMTKPEIMKMFRLGERKARDCVNAIAKRVPIMSLSSGKGYKWARSIDDPDNAIAARNELRSRKKEMQEREERLTEFINSFVINEKEGQSGNS